MRRTPVVILSILLLALLGACAGTGTPRDTPNDENETTESRPEASAASRLAFAPLRAIIRDHRERGTHIDGARCPMYPSCAAYAERALNEGGFMGFLYFIDRLFYREFGRLSERYLLAPRHMSQSPRYYDPLSDVLPPENGRRASFFREDFR